MVNWIKREHTKNQVNESGKRVRKGEHTDQDISVIENHRASHSYVLNTFQSTLRNRARGKQITFGQRLKRMPTILDKLQRQEGMKLARMHDIAGCRLIFRTESELHAFRNSLHEARMKHTLHNGPKGDKYDYIKRPKASGYRGIHDVYEYDVNSETGTHWNGLLIELQYRTRYQHAWATAVEVADLTTSNRIKFDDAQSEYRDFFKLASEIIARGFEGKTSCFPEMSDRELMVKFRWVNHRLGLMDKFKHLATVQAPKRFKKNTILQFAINPKTSKRSLDVESYDSVVVALKRYAELEAKADEYVDVVLVQAANRESMREAFKNYFSDTKEFSRYINKGMEKLAIKVLNTQMVEGT